MNELQNQILTLVQHTYSNGIKPCIIEEQDTAYLLDPVFHIKRNRVIAETVKALIRSTIESKDMIKKLLHYLIFTQHENGSWSEIHAQYNQPSALITSIVADAFLLAIEKKILKKSYSKIVSRAKDFVISQEKKPGYFLKSSQYTADHLNVDATCAAFLAHYGSYFNDDALIEVSKRTSDHIIEYQWDNGVYPYAIDKGSYAQVKQVPCIHYQGVTLYYLSQIHSITQDDRLLKSIISGGNWLLAQQREHGFFDWSKSGLLFTYYVSGAYAFALSSFLYVSKFDTRFKKSARLCLPVLSAQHIELFLRWEHATWEGLLRSLFDSMETAKLLKKNSKQFLFRLGYAIYRQIARRRYNETVDEKLFNVLVGLFQLKVSTIEPFANYPDLFMTSEILDCLSYIKELNH